MLLVWFICVTVKIVALHCSVDFVVLRARKLYKVDLAGEGIAGLSIVLAL